MGRGGQGGKRLLQCPREDLGYKSGSGEKSYFGVVWEVPKAFANERCGVSKSKMTAEFGAPLKWVEGRGAVPQHEEPGRRNVAQVKWHGCH